MKKGINCQKKKLHTCVCTQNQYQGSREMTLAIASGIPAPPWSVSSDTCGETVHRCCTTPVLSFGHLPPSYGGEIREIFFFFLPLSEFRLRVFLSMEASTAEDNSARHDIDLAARQISKFALSVKTGFSRAKQMANESFGKALKTDLGNNNN